LSAPHREWVVDNSAWAAPAPPRLSVLIPFLRDDPCALLKALDDQAPVGVEMVLLDDGSADDALASRVAAAVGTLACPARFVRLIANEGRAKGRNRLARHARAPYFLFMDSDMAPDSPDFLAAYISLIDEQQPAVAFGGFSVKLAPPVQEYALHRAMAARSDCLPASQRRLRPEKTVFTSNLLIRRDVFEAEAFDEAFTGWGWEDVEWAARVGRKHAIVHVDNTATHLGLDPAKVLISKYEQSVSNFGRLAKAHPQIVAAYPSFKAAKVMALAPLRGTLKRVLKSLALNESAPLGVRAFSLRLLRAALYAEVV
jgi:glycosyltransferase involved in cell wall biosynthesis